MQYSAEDVRSKKLTGLDEKIRSAGVSGIADELGVGVPTLRDIINELLKPGRDPRDELPKPMLHSDVLQMEDLKARNDNHRNSQECC